jgi:hypothetical protein
MAGAKTWKHPVLERILFKSLFCFCIGVSVIISVVAGHQWLMPIILDTQEAEISRIRVRSQPRHIIHETLSQKTFYKNRTGGVAQGEGPEFKPQCHTHKKRRPVVFFQLLGM